jgi:hypothetical protein
VLNAEYACFFHPEVFFGILLITVRMVGHFQNTPRTLRTNEEINFGKWASSVLTGRREAAALFWQSGSDSQIPPS